ncbi:hypothetical protein scyTo_0012562 [Scyliorhinus torazame]|uniref:Exonuclease domain-containing protein n=1 Tax=Scyliorhinus torazame TaxID=75743 RepID=A0A401PAN5_SCYTO|nr:hypothetical protein [Scyliorhinus torazame]
MQVPRMPSVAGKRVASPVSKDSSSRRLLQVSSSSTQFLHCTSGVTLSPSGQTAKRKKKPSRRHARFLERKAFLERKGILKRSRFKKKEGPFDQARGPSASNLNHTAHSGDPERPSASDENINSSILPGASQPEAESSHFTFFLKSTKPSSRAHSVQRTAPLTREDSASCLASPPHFCSKPAKYVAIDCEMVGTGPCGRVNEVARCSIVNYQGDVIYDKYVKPGHPITDYRTRWSGIRKQHMANAIGFDVAQREVGRDGHCSVEDACASMELYRLVEIQWEKKQYNRLSATEREHTASETNSEIDQYMGDQYWPADLHEDSK